MGSKSQEGRRRFAGRSIVVLGGARGIGAATADAFAAEGGSVTIGDVLEREGEATAAAIRSTGGQARFIRCDVAKSDDLQTLVGAAVRAYGGIDVLFYNVGIVRYGRVEDLSESDWDVALGANLRGIFLACKYVIPELRKRGGGAIVNTASALAHASQPLTAAYSASKGGVMALSRTIAVDHAAENIRCNTISPGTIDTPIVRIAAEQIDRERVAELIASWGKMHPIGRVGRVEEVAAVVLFLASDEASFITGADFSVDGGLRASLIKQ